MKGLVDYNWLKASGIYCIVNTVTRKRYVGQAKNIWQRWTNHKRLLTKQTHSNIKLQRSWNKYGPDKFVFDTLEIVSVERLTAAEQFWIDYYNSCEAGYNIAPKAASAFGVKLTNEQKAKVSAKLKERWKDPVYRAHMAERARVRVRTQDEIDRRRAKVIGRKYGKTQKPWTDKQRAAITAANKGRKWTDEQRIKVAETKAKRKLERNQLKED